MLAEHEYPALVLNGDLRPLSYHPLSLWSWHDTVKAVFSDRVNVLAEYDRVVRSRSFEMRLPSVVCLKGYVAAKRGPAFTRFNIYLRDAWTCAYCGERKPTRDLTFDHVLPRSRGGRTVWTNIVTCCREDNARKADRTPEEAGMPLLFRPRVPSRHELREVGRRVPQSGALHKDWIDFLYWDAVLDE